MMERSQPPGVFSTWADYNDWLRSSAAAFAQLATETRAEVNARLEETSTAAGPTDEQERAVTPAPPSPAHPAPPDGFNGRTEIGGRTYRWCHSCGQWELA